MPYQMKPLACDPARVRGMSERLIVSHYENNYGGAVKRLNLIEEQLAGRDFGGVERWRAEFVAMGKALAGGSGWVLLSYSPRDGRLVNQWAADHATTLAGGQPILALDMYEHSYHLDFGAKAGGYVDTFMQVVRWASADHLYALVRGDA